ncbi:MAG: APC family permease [Pseudomonadota bacterium]
MRADKPALHRALNLPLLVLYGLGTIVGAGIYALLGEVAGAAGYGAPLSFLIAAIVASFTACSFAELAARYPRAAGAALYVQNGFNSNGLAKTVGLLVVASGVVSAAALTNGFVGYLQAVIDIDRELAVIAIVFALGALAAWGIAQSAAVAAAITVIEIGGLLTVIIVGGGVFAELPARWREFVPVGAGPSLGGILVGVTLSFYAFIGFEDMVDVAEEVRDVRRTMPRAILLALVVATAIYVLLLVSALLTLPPQELSASSAPIVALYEAHTGREPLLLGVIAMFAIINGALIQIVMASRVLYGLAARGQLSARLAQVNPRTRTPLLATAGVSVTIMLLALVGRLGGLAVMTSLIMLAVFASVNLSLWRIKGRAADQHQFRLPRWSPLVGAILSLAFIAWEVVLRIT